MTMRISVSVLLVSALCAAGPALAQSGKKSAGGGAAVVAPACPGQALNITAPTLCTCAPGAGGGSVWGSGPYTADSSICTAALHAGVLGRGGGAVQVIPRPGQSSYAASTANGVATSGWGSYGQSFDVVAGGTPTAFATGLPRCETMPAGAAEHVCSCPANAATGSLWGNGPYTADSDICTAARHAGYIDEDGGDVYVLRIQGLEAYVSGESYGITSADWGAYGESIVFDWNR